MWAVHGLLGDGAEARGVVSAEGLRRADHPLPFAAELAEWALKCDRLRDKRGGAPLNTFFNRDLARQVR